MSKQGLFIDGKMVHVEPAVNRATVNPKDVMAFAMSKVPLSVVPMTFVSYAAVQMHNGAGKYGRHNFRGTGVLFSMYYEAILRHAMALWDGEEFDEEGVHNLCGLSANAAILCDAHAHGYLIDDRPPKVNQRAVWDSFKPMLRANCARNAEKEPRHFTHKDSVHKA